MVKTEVNVAMGDLFYGKVVSCPEKVSYIKNSVFKCQYVDGFLQMKDIYAIKTSRIEKISQARDTAIFVTNSGSTYVLEIQ